MSADLVQNVPKQSGVDMAVCVRRIARSGLATVRKAFLVVFALAFIAAGAAALAFTPAAASSSGIDLSMSPDGPVTTELSLQPAPGSNSGRLKFFIRQSGDTPLTGAHVATSPTDLQVNVTTDTGDARFTIPPSGQAVAMVVTVEGLEKPVDARVDLFVQSDDRNAQTVGVLRVTRADAPALSAVGDSGTGLSFNQDREAFSRQILLRSDTSADVRATVTYTPLQDESSRQVPLALALESTPVANGSVVEVPARTSRMLTVEASLPWASTYRATLTFSYGENSTSVLTVPLAVVRTATTQTIVAETVDTSRGSRSFCWHFFGCAGSKGASATVTFRETAGENTGFDPLHVRGVRVDDSGTMVQSNDVDALVRFPDQSPDGGATSLPIAIGPRESAVVVTDLGGLTKAGKYEVVLRGDTPGAPPVDVTATILVRDSVLYAVILILAGSLLSALLKWWIGSARGSLGVRVEVDSLYKRIDKIVASRTPSTPRKVVVNEVRRIVRRADAVAQDRGSTPEVRAALVDATSRVDLLDEWLEICAVADESGASEEAEKLLEKARDLLVGDAAIDAAVKQTITGALRDALFLVDKDTATQRREQIAVILSQQAPPLGFDQAEWDALVATMNPRVQNLGDPASNVTARVDSDQILRELIFEISVHFADRLASKAVAVDQAGKADLATKLRTLETQVRGANQLAATGSLRNALDQYRQCIEEYKALEPVMTAAGQQMGAAAGKPLGVDAVPLASTHPTTAVSDHGNARRAALYAGNVLAFGVVALVTALLGVVALYQPNPTWGASMDWLTAFLWGMGLYQVGGAASQGIQSVWNSYRGA